jgi:hypothetical protein
LVKLQKILNTPNPIRIIEGIDIANIGGKEAVGSLVKFIDGRPFKAGYRRFRIKTVEGADDYAMIAEVVKRRYKYALRGKELWPDLILIDGGLGQLHAAQAALREIINYQSSGGGDCKTRGGALFAGRHEALEIAEAVAGIKVIAIRPRRGTPIRPALFPHTAKKETSGMIDY